MVKKAVIEIVGIDKVMRQLSPAAGKRAMHTAMDSATQMIELRLKRYPGEYHETRAAGLLAPYWTPRQRRYFWWALRKGDIVLPYRRGKAKGSKKLGSRWTRRVTQTAYGYQGTVGTNVPYAPFVLDEKLQARPHRGRWETLQKRVEKVTPDVRQRIDEILRAALHRGG